MTRIPYNEFSNDLERMRDVEIPLIKEIPKPCDDSECAHGNCEILRRIAFEKQEEETSKAYILQLQESQRQEQDRKDSL